MKKKVLKLISFTLILLSMLMVKVNAATIKLQECEYSDAYKAWLNLSEEDKKKTIRPYMCKTNTSYSYNTSLKGSASEIVSRSRYNLQDESLVTAVRNQGPVGSCWAHAAIAGIESNLLKNNKGVYDLSEAHMELATQSTYSLPFKTFKRTFSSGGNIFIAGAYLLNHRGTVLESKIPYEYAEDLVEWNDSKNDYLPIQPDSHTNDIMSEVANEKATIGVDGYYYSGYASCDANAKSKIKQYLATNGAVPASMYYSESGLALEVIDADTKSFKFKGNYFYGPYYYYNGTKECTNSLGSSVACGTNHAVTIIGWDDTISKDLFNGLNGAKPAGDGAWIVKNSYGSVMQKEYEDGTYTFAIGDNGIYYVSYYDVNICSLVASIYGANNKVEDNTYYYDELNDNNTFFGNRDLDLGVKFKTKNEEEILKKVSFAVEANTNYEVYYSTNGGFKNATLIASGTATERGYETITPKSEIKITSDEFSIYVKYKANDYSGTKISIIPISVKTKDGSFWDNNVITPSVSYLSADGISWVDTASSQWFADASLNGDANDYELVGFNASIKAYTDTVTAGTSNNDDSYEEDNNNSNDEDKVNEGNDKIVVEENPKNEQSYIDTTDQTKNPSTADTNVILIIAFAVIVTIIIKYASKKLKRKRA